MTCTFSSLFFHDWRLLLKPGLSLLYLFEILFVVDLEVVKGSSLVGVEAF